MNAKIKTALVLVYFAIVGFLVDFFMYFTPFEITATMHGSSTRTLAEWCVSGSIKGGGFSYLLSILLLIAMLVITIIISVKSFKQSDFSYGLFIAAIAIGVACFILAIVQLSVFTRIKWASTTVDSESLTAIGGGEFLFLYISSFEAAATAITAGIVGIMGVKEESYSYRRTKYVPKPNYQRTSVVSSSSSGAGSTSFDVNDIVVCRFASGTTVNERQDGMIVSVRLTRDTELEIVALSPDKTKATLKRLSDGKVFNDVYLYSFMVARKGNQVSKEPEAAKKEEPKPQQSKPQQPEAAVETESKKIELLKEYKQLLDEGIITQEEFDKKKKELL